MSPSSRLRKNAEGICRENLATAGARPSRSQREWLMLGTRHDGGRLPLYGADGREIPRRTVNSCIAHGWVEPWIPNPIRPEGRICRLTKAGWAAVTDRTAK